MKAYNLRCDFQENPIQVGECPRFSWMLPPDHTGISQLSYRIRVKAKREGELYWDTGPVLSDQSVHIPYGGKPLLPDTAYIWEIKFTDEKGVSSLWNEAEFETGLSAESFKAKWIGYDRETQKPFDPSIPFYCADDFDKGKNAYYLPPLPYLRKSFKLPHTPISAKLYISAFGLAHAEINGKACFTDRFVPGYSDYSKTVFSRAYDVTPLLKKGENAIGIILADGWYSGYIGLNNRQWYGNSPRVSAQLEITLDSGKSFTLITDESWKAAYGAFLESDIMQGETFDARLIPEGFSTPSYNDSGWDKVQIGAEHEHIPKPHPGCPVRMLKTLPVQSQTSLKDGSVILDFGECFSGVVRLNVSGKSGSSVTIQHSEILTPAGELHLAGNRSARCRDQYILCGKGTEVFEPKFTYHSFRYAQVFCDKNACLISAEGIVIGSHIPEQNKLSCSSETAEQVLEMIRRTARSNCFEVPTDCSARDERLGWGMEGNHFLDAMARLENNYLFIKKWTEDIWDSQYENGNLNPIAPPMMMKDIEQYAGDLQSYHGLHTLYILLKVYGDSLTAQKYYPGLIRFFDFLDQNSDRHIRIATTGDWLGLWEKSGKSDFQHGYGECSPPIIGTAHYAIGARRMAEISKTLGKAGDHKRFSDLYGAICKAFRQNYIQRDGTLRSTKQGDYIMTLAAGFFCESEAKKAAQWLGASLLKHGHICWNGGTPTTPYFLSTLRLLGMHDLANLFLTSKKYPSIGYMHTKGATAVWERWDGIWEDGSLHPQAMNAMNHIGLCSIGKDYTEGLLGVRPLMPGYKQIGISPGVSQEILHAKGCIDTVYGKIGIQWEHFDERLYLHLKIPPNTTGLLTFDKRRKIISSNRAISDDRLLFPGSYEITAEWVL